MLLGCLEIGILVVGVERTLEAVAGWGWVLLQRLSRVALVGGVHLLLLRVELSLVEGGVAVAHQLARLRIGHHRAIGVVTSLHIARLESL